MTTVLIKYSYEYIIHFNVIGISFLYKIANVILTFNKFAVENEKRSVECVWSHQKCI